MATKYHRSKDGQIRVCSAVAKCRLEVVTSEEWAEQQKTIMSARGTGDGYDSKGRLIPNVKTAYRETATAFGIQNIVELNKLLALSSDEYVALTTRLDSQAGISPVAKISWKAGNMPQEIRETISSNHALGKAIADYRDQNTTRPTLADVKWVGADTSLAPADLLVDSEKWSLKDNSQILRNGAANALMNVLTGTKKYERGYHLIASLAPQENLAALRYAVTEYNKHNVTQGETETVPVPDSFDEYRTYSGEQRKRIAEFINTEQETNKTFYDHFSSLKTKANVVAGEAVISQLTNNIQAGELLNMGDEYYYAKITNGETHIGHIPGVTEINKNVRVKRVSAVTTNQLSILSVFENERHEELTTVHEIRYAHGQFFGVPEAKLKITKGNLVEFLKP